ncbi:M55 family metallopeptidase [Halobacillus amylolyticus]|uniref:M55 family metallopeptidase n=1 Tax=Halobacillus amylolyticus TaxID=2932259 RepID=A0ABY4HHM3_9BACI|nr:M55 family metallopeptidase [Halobacillus amylolyticus]UOR13365.1 M55 family metallopeptidase [Halobacillus amylolyticus]
MKLYISVDMEGVTGLPDATFVESTKHNYERGRKLMTDETNDVIQSAFDEKVSEIIVNDSHSKMNNLLVEYLHPEAQLITGDVKPFSMVQGLDHLYDGAIFVGYHARAGQRGVMSHSMTSAVRNFFIDEVVVGELGLNAYFAGYFGVPILMVAGDDMATQEAEKLIPNIVTAPVKETISRSAVKTLSPKKAGELLKRKTAEAIDKRSQIQPLVPPSHPTLRIEFANYGQAEWASLMPGTKMESNSTIVSFKAKDIREAYQAMLVMTELATRTTFS